MKNRFDKLFEGSNEKSTPIDFQTCAKAGFRSRVTSAEYGEVESVDFPTSIHIRLFSGFPRC